MAHYTICLLTYKLINMPIFGSEKITLTIRQGETEGARRDNHDNFELGTRDGAHLMGNSRVHLQVQPGRERPPLCRSPLGLRWASVRTFEIQPAGCRWEKLYRSVSAIDRAFSRE